MEEQSHTSRRSWRRWLVRIGLTVTVVLVLLLALALAATQTSTFRSYLRTRAVEAANTALAGRVSVGSIDGSLLGSLILNDVVLTLDGTEILAAREVSADYSLLPLLTSGTLVIEAARATGVRAHLVQDAQGWNISRIVPPGEEDEPESTGTPIDIRVEELILDDARLDVVLPDRSYAIRDVVLRGSLEIDDAGQRAEVEHLTLALPERDLRLAELRASIASHDDGSLALEDVTLKTAESSISGGALIGSAQRDYDVQLALELAAAELHRLIGQEVLATDLSAKLVATGPPQKLQIDAEVSTTDAGKIGVGGNVDLSSERLGYDLRLALDHLNIAGVLGPEQPATDLSGSLTAEGAGYTLEDVRATLAAELSDSAVADTRIVRLAASGTIDNRQVAASADLATDVGNGTLNGTLDLAREAYDVTVDATQLDPMGFLNRPDLPARINGRAVVSGAGFDLPTAQAQADVHLDDSTVDQLRVQVLDARLALAGGRLTVERLQLDSNAAQASASGAVEVVGLGDQDAGAATGNIQYSVQVSDLGVIASIAGQRDVAGRATLDGTASGSLRALDVDAKLSGADLAGGGAQLATLTADVQARALGSDSATATIAARATQLRVGGRSFMLVRPQMVWQAGPNADNLRVDLQVREDSKHEHALRATAEIQGNEVRAVLETLRLALGDDVWANRAPARVAWRDGRAEIIGMEMRSNGGTVTINGTGGTEGAQDLQVRVDGIALAPLLQPDVADVSGTLSGVAHLRGSASAPRLDVEASVERAEIEGMTYESVRAAMQVADGRARADARIVQSGQNELTLTAALDVQLALSPFAFALGERLSGELRAADVELAIFDPLLPQVSQLKGRLDANVTLGGSPRAPEVRGPISIRDGGARIAASGVTYDPIELQMSLDGRAIDVQNLRIAAGDGSLTGSGSARLTAAGPEGAVTIVLQQFPVFSNRYGEGVTNGRIEISGSAAAPMVEGTIETERLVFRMPEKLPGKVRPPDPTITVIRPIASPDPQSGQDPEDPTAAPSENGATPPTAEGDAATPGVYDRATIRIEIRVPHNAWLLRSDAEIDLRGALTVTKDPGEPLAVAGEISTVRGWYTFQGRKFTVEEGTVTLTGQDFNPLLDVVAEYTTGDYLVRIRIGGTVQVPTLKLESEPMLPQADILSVLVFGRPADQLSQGESQGLRERALAVAGGYAASELRRSVADAIGVDTLEIEPGSEGLANTSASVGKYITDDIFVSLSHKFGEQNVQQLRVQYFFTPRWTIETTADTDGQSGIDIFWRRRY